MILSKTLHQWVLTLQPQIFRNILNDAHYYGRAARKKNHSSLKLRGKKWLEFAKEHLNKAEEFWDCVIFSDESKFDIFESDGK